MEKAAATMPCEWQPSGLLASSLVLARLLLLGSTFTCTQVLSLTSVRDSTVSKVTLSLVPHRATIGVPWYVGTKMLVELVVDSVALSTPAMDGGVDVGPIEVLD